MLTSSTIDVADSHFLNRAIELALATEAQGNFPIGAVITLGSNIVATGANQSFQPCAHPGRHAEIMALRQIPDELVSRLPEMTCYTTLEPCLMCFGALVLHGLGRVVFGANDPLGGAVALSEHLPPFVAQKMAAMIWVGPANPELCDPLWKRTEHKYWHEEGRHP